MDPVRDLVARNVVPGARIFLTKKPNEHPSMLTAIHQTLLWQRLPDPVGFGDLHSVERVDAFLVPRTDTPPTLEADDTRSFLHAGETKEWSLWVKEEIALPGPLPPIGRIPVWQEFAGFLPLLMVLACGAYAAGTGGAVGAVSLLSILLFASLSLPIPFTRMTVLAVSALTCIITFSLNKRYRKVGQGICAVVQPTVKRYRIGMAVALFILLSALALTHTFLPPNGLAVVGGKAKLLALCNGFPSGFFTSADWKSLEPAYPPGLASLLAGCYAISGGCGEWCTQIIGCAAMSFLLFTLLKRTRAAGGGFWFAALFLPQLCLEIGSSLYPDPFLAILVVAGWQRVSEKEADWLGWFLIGSSGWFKNEGIVYLLAAWLSLRATKGPKAAPLPHLLAALTVPLAWQIGCRIMGATLNDYAPLYSPDLRKLWAVCLDMVKYCFTKPWEYAFAYPILIVSLILFLSKKSRRSAFARMIPVSLLTAFSLLAFAWLYACSLAADFRWHLETGLTRLLWIPALLIVYEFLILPKSPALENKG